MLVLFLCPFTALRGAGGRTLPLTPPRSLRGFMGLLGVYIEMVDLKANHVLISPLGVYKWLSESDGASDMNDIRPLEFQTYIPPITSLEVPK